ncbi:hypothetical protein DDI_1164 [Dickeya dianthicola RNS04.9]|nr:hypothetical protein DDI_1164 [Dickeya dianthicola RNS04.9]
MSLISELNIGKLLNEVNIKVISPRDDVITVKLEDTHHFCCSNLAAISAFESIKSLGEHFVAVCSDSKHFNTNRSYAHSPLEFISQRESFIDAGSDGNPFVNPNSAGCEPLLYGNFTLILRKSSEKGGHIFNRCWHGVSFQLSTKLLIDVL